MYKKSAFSLLELLVVIAIIAVLIGLGVYALLNLRSTTVVKQALTEFSENMTSIRNQARNSVVAGRVVPINATAERALTDTINNLDFYAVRFVEDNYQRGTCNSISSNQAECTFIEQPLLSMNANLVDVVPENTECEAIVFSLSTGKYRFANISGNTVSFNSRNTCTYTFRNSGFTGAELSIQGDTETNKFEII